MPTDRKKWDELHWVGKTVGVVVISIGVFALLLVLGIFVLMLLWIFKDVWGSVFA